MELLQFVLELQPEVAEQLNMDKELHLKSKDNTALKRQKGTFTYNIG